MNSRNSASCSAPMTSPVLNGKGGASISDGDAVAGPLSHEPGAGMSQGPAAAADEATPQAQKTASHRIARRCEEREEREQHEERALILRVPESHERDAPALAATS